MKPLVSVIIPFYSNYYLLKRAIKSIFNQSYKNYEIIIIDDNPKKNIKNIITSFTKKLNLKKVKIIKNRKNYGAGKSRNKGINISKGKYIAFLDSDDIWKANKLSSQIQFMEKKKYTATHTSYNIIDMKKNFISSRKAKNLSYNDLLKSCDIGLSTVVLRKKILEFKNPFPSLNTKEDYVLWLKIAKKGIIFNGIDKKLTNWTYRPGSLSKSTLQKLKDSIIVYYKYEKFSFINSLYKTFILSLNYIKKK